MNEIPKIYALDCPTCGKTIDLRDLGQVFSHGMMNNLTGRYECEPEDIKMPGVTARKVGDPVEWKDGKPTNLN